MVVDVSWSPAGMRVGRGRLESRGNRECISGNLRVSMTVIAPFQVPVHRQARPDEVRAAFV